MAIRKRSKKQHSGSRMMGEGENFGKGQTRRGGAPTRGGRGAGPRKETFTVDTRRHDTNAVDVGGSPTEPPLASSTRPQDKGYERRWDET